MNKRTVKTVQVKLSLEEYKQVALAAIEEDMSPGRFLAEFVTQQLSKTEEPKSSSKKRGRRKASHESHEEEE